LNIQVEEKEKKKKEELERTKREEEELVSVTGNHGSYRTSLLFQC